MKILLLCTNLRGQPDTAIEINPLPLGPLYLAAALRQAGHARISIVDAGAQDLSHEEVMTRVRSFAPDLVGISSLSTGSREAHKLAALIKKADARCKIVIGGPYAFTSPKRIIEDPNIDFVVVGEGERTICELADALEKGKVMRGISGLVFKEDGVPTFNTPREAIEDIDSIPFPAWDLVDMETYFDPAHTSPARRNTINPFPASNRVIPIFTSRGCPFGCIYCHNIFGKRIRLRSVENVLREIELLVEKYAPGEIEIFDDIFNFDLDRAKRICDEIIKRGIKIVFSFPNGLRVDRMDEELVVKLKAAGARHIYYAIESADPEVQKRIRKNIDLAKAGEMIRLTAGRGIVTNGFFMLGFPGETKEELLKTIAFAKEMPFHMVVFSYVTPRPNTPLQALLEKDGIDLESARVYNYSKLSINLSAMTDSELEKLWVRANLEFYLRPKQMWRIWGALPDKKVIFQLFLRLVGRCVRMALRTQNRPAVRNVRSKV